MKVLFFTDISISGKSIGGHVNSVKSILKFFRGYGNVDFISLFDARGIVLNSLLFIFRLETKFYRWIYSVVNKTNAPADKYKFSLALLVYFFVYLRLTKPNVFIVEYIHFAYLKIVTPRGVYFLIDTGDIMHLRTESYKLNGFVDIPSNSKIEKIAEIEVFNNADAIIVIQEDEYDYIKGKIKSKAILAPRHFESVISPKVDKEYNYKIGFIGGSADFNVDGLTRFIDEVWLQLSKVNFSLNIYGTVVDGLSESTLTKIKANNIIVHGKVADVSEVYDNCDIMVNPIYYGSGLKTKNVESVCNGTPVITTKIGAQGMNRMLDKGLYIYDSKESFAMILDAFTDINYFLNSKTLASEYAGKLFGLEVCYSQLKEYLDYTINKQA